MKKNFILFLFFVNIFIALKPIKEDNVKWLSLGAGTSSSLITLAVTQQSKNKLLFSVIAAGITGYLTYKIAMTRTPNLKYKKAKRIIDKCLYEELIIKEFYNIDSFVRYCLGRFGTNWPLVDARLQLDYVRLDLFKARSLLNSAYNETLNDNKYFYIRNEYSTLNKNINNLLDLITDKMSVLISSKLYKNQMKQYERYLKEERKRKEKQQDYWHQLNKERERKKERERDRELLENLTNHGATHIGVNLNMNGR